MICSPPDPYIQIKNIVPMLPTFDHTEICRINTIIGFESPLDILYEVADNMSKVDYFMDNNLEELCE